MDIIMCFRGGKFVWNNQTMCTRSVEKFIFIEALDS